MRNTAAFILLLVAAALALCGAALASADDASSGAYKIVVNPSNPATTLDRKFVEYAFLKKVTTWPDGLVIHPVDLVSSSPVRRRFSEDVLGRSVSTVGAYWQQRIFSGRDVPPPEFDTDEDVIAYVLKYDGAIGYVSASASLKGTKVVALR